MLRSPMGVVLLVRCLLVPAAILSLATCKAPIDVGENLDGGCDGGCAPDASGAGRDAGACPEGLFECDADGGPLCVDTDDDPRHCGACGRSCASDVCTGGTCCEDPSGRVCVDPDETRRCVDPLSDALHCGGCGRSCESGNCIDGECCGAACGGRCVPDAFDVLWAWGEEEARQAYLEDLDGDGYDDAAYPLQLAERIFVFWGNTDGGIDIPTVIQSGRVGPGLSFGDVDEDGAVDVVAAIQSQGPPFADQIRILRGLGGRGFSDEALIIEQNHNPNWTALLDVDADGHLDLLTRLPGLGCIGLRIGDGTGGFGDDRGCVVGYASVRDEEAIRAADLDGDGTGELLELRGPPSDELWVHDFATFAETGAPLSETIPTPARVPVDFFDVWDADGDGRDDVIGFERDREQGTWSIRADSGSESCLFATGIGGQDDIGWQFLGGVGDLDGDGRMDIVAFVTCGGCLSRLYLYRGSRL